MMANGSNGSVFGFGPYSLDVGGRTLNRGNAEVMLGSRAFDLLTALVQRPGEVISRRELMSVAWSGLNVEESNLRVQMAHLRRKLGCGVEGTRYITSVAGRGYCFVAPVMVKSEQIDSGIDTAREPPIAPQLVVADSPFFRPQRLPRLVERLFGREENGAELEKAIKSWRFVTVVGPGGVGKTSLALAVAQKLTGFETVHFVDLSTVLTQDRVIDAVAAVGGLNVVPGVSPLERFVEHVAKQRSLVVLDNCEHVIDAVAGIIEFVRERAEGTHLLVTSREALRLPGEAIYLLRPLGVPPNAGRLTPEQAIAWPSVELFMDRAARGGFLDALDDRNAAVIGTICRRLDGNPLAIELAASRVGSYGLEKVAALIDNQLVLQWRAKRNAERRHQTVEAMLDWSYDLLTETSKLFLQRLSVFAGDFSLHAALAVAKANDSSPSEASQMIDDLVEKSLVSAFSPEGSSRLRLLEITKTYATAKLGETGTGRGVRRIHAVYYVECLRKLASDRSVRTDAETGFDVQFDVDNVLAALDWAFSEDGELPLALELCKFSIPMFMDQWRMVECTKWCRRALSAIPERLTGSDLELRLLEGFATSSFYTSHNVTETDAAFQTGIELSKRLKDHRTEFHLRAGQHFLALKSGSYPKMLDLAKRYAADAEIKGGPIERVVAQWLLGSSYQMCGDQKLSQEAYDVGFLEEAALGLSPLGQLDIAQKAVARILHARMVWLRGSHNRSLQFVEEAIRDARQDVGPLCVTLVVGVEVLLLCGKFDEARPYVQRLNTLTRRYSLAGLHEAGLTMRDQLRLFQGHTDRAIDLLRAHLDAVLGGRLVASTLTALGALAQGLNKLGAHEEAMTAINAALAVDENAGGSFRQPELLRIKAIVLADAPKPRLDKANSLLKRALCLAREHSSLSWELRIATDIARLGKRTGEEEAKQSLHALREILTRFDGGEVSADVSAARNLLDGKASEEESAVARPSAEHAPRH